MDHQGLVAVLVVAGYLLGAIPFGIVVSKAMGLPDPRTVGSKNVGFTNVLRVSGTKAGVLTLLGDLGKGDGDPRLTLFGRKVTPNHHALAEQFVTLDNFYADGEVSEDGHACNRQKNAQARRHLPAK